jgi:hypothetical protein
MACGSVDPHGLLSSPLASARLNSLPYMEGRTEEGSESLVSTLVVLIPSGPPTVSTGTGTSSGGWWDGCEL